MKSELKIALREANNEFVSLKKMTSTAVESFIEVVSSLRALTIAILAQDDVVFSLVEGSASCVAEASQDNIEMVYREINHAIEGECENKDITDPLRNIQEHLKKSNLVYNFSCNINNENIYLQQKIINATRISVKRKTDRPSYKIKIVHGILNQIGGTDPNYHLNEGANNKLTISCTREVAKDVNQFLYEDISVLVLCKEKPDDKVEYIHKKVICEEEVLHLLNGFLSSYYEQEDLMVKLDLFYETLDKAFLDNNPSKFLLLKYLLIAFNDINLDIHDSELKTLLVLSKAFKNHELISEPRNFLLQTYQKKNK